MNRLQSELHRLYFTRSSDAAEGEASASALIGPSGTVRALVIELARPASWELLSKVWRGVQTELELPAPAIAVSGTDGLQLWFSLAEPVTAARAHAFLEGLRARFLSDVVASRIRLLPAPNASALQPLDHARRVPALQAPGENWSAFVAPDLAPVFADTPWLDVAPGDEGQATLLQGLESVKPAAFAAALQRLASNPLELALTATDAPPERDGRATAEAAAEATRFLRQTMNDDTVALALRIEAAKALRHTTGD